ncbi:MAG: TRAP transporter substrate-binding protein [Desulfobacterales bacterium]|nr:TRAP transporter substrate-binding protein [Desulfobacterales bacterium]
MTKKTSIILVFAVLIVCLLNIPGYALNLRFNIMYNQKHPLSRDAFAPWAKQVKEVTDGRVKVTMFYSNALFKPKAAMDSIISRVGDIGIVLPVYDSNRLMLSSVMDQPMIAGEKALKNSEVLWQLYTTEPEMQTEFKDVKVLWAYMNPAFQLHFSKKEVKGLADLENTIISAGGATQTHLLRLLGASPEAMPMVEVFLAMQKGVIEGCFLPYAPLRSQKIADLLKYHTNANLMAVSFFVTINKKAWDKISPEDQKAIESISGLNAARKCGQVFDNAQQKDTTWMLEKGDSFYSLTPEQKQSWALKIKPVRDKWIQAAKEKGYTSPDKVMEKAISLFAQ